LSYFSLYSDDLIWFGKLGTGFAEVKCIPWQSTWFIPRVTGYFSKGKTMTSSNNNQGNKQGNQNQDQNQNSNRGFASMDPQRQREIASEGGRAAHEKGTAHEFTSEEAREAGRQSHKNDGSQSNEQSNRNEGNKANASNTGNTRGGSSEQHAEAGRQSHKNDNK
jgi:general stress protein YciG